MLLLEVAARPLYAHAATGNGASLRVLQKCGFVVERVRLSPATDRYPECEEAVLVLRQAQAHCLNERAVERECRASQTTPHRGRRLPATRIVRRTRREGTPVLHVHLFYIQSLKVQILYV